MCYHFHRMDISILFDEGFEQCLAADWLEQVMAGILVLAKASSRSEVSLVITGLERIRQLNKQYLDEDGPTDVISFAMTELPEDNQPFINPPDDSVHLGEVIICYPQAVKQAEEHHHDVKKELVLLMIHGALHLLGFDHGTPEEEKTMRGREADILKIIGEKYL